MYDVASDVPPSVRLDFERMGSRQGIAESVESKIDEGDPFVKGSNARGNFAQVAFGLIRLQILKLSRLAGWNSSRARSIREDNPSRWCLSRNLSIVGAFGSNPYDQKS
jgi:hypothetical protein